jgi:hypothetical protein
LEYEAKFMVIELQPDIVTQSKHVSSPEFDDMDEEQTDGGISNATVQEEEEEQIAAGENWIP